MFRLHRLTRVGKILLDLGILSGAFCLAFLIRFEGFVPAPYWETLLVYLPWVVIGQLIFLCAGSGRRPTWRYTGLQDTVPLFVRLALASLLFLGWRQLAEADVSGP